MGWERRAGSGALYYYRTRRGPAGQIIKEYCGRGQRARAAADAVARSQTQRKEDHQAVREEQGRLAGPDSLMDELVGVAQLLLEATLLAQGFHRPNYGAWRRKRRGKQEGTRTTARAGSAG